MSNEHRGREHATQLIRKRGGVIATRDALRLGIHPRTLYAMRDEGVLEKLRPGLYRLAELPPLSVPDLVSVAARAPGGVICLISALAYHEITTQIPHEVYIAIRRDTRPPRVNYPPTRIFKFSAKAFSAGVETHTLDGFSVRIYSVEKTLADCFKYRNKIGLDTAIEALRLYRERRGTKIDLIMQYARVCRVEKVIRPYLEALL